MMPVLLSGSDRSFLHTQWQFEKGSLTGLENSQSDSWGMLVLVGAGLCLGEGFKQSGLVPKLPVYLQELKTFT